jgi:hypothetical protein
LHGLIFSELRKYATARLGERAWEPLLAKAGLAGKLYVRVSTYPDTDVTAIVSAAAATTGRPVQAVLEDFGEFMAPDLLAAYGELLKAEWKTLDVIENTEATMHRFVRVNNPGATPPQLVSKRASEREVIVVYSSPRKLCAIAKGIIRGIAKERGESVTITEPACMLKGEHACRLHVRLDSPA